MKYSVTTTRRWTVDDVEAENAKEAREIAYNKIDGDCGDDFDETDIEEMDNE